MTVYACAQRYGAIRTTVLAAVAHLARRRADIISVLALAALCAGVLVTLGAEHATVAVLTVLFVQLVHARVAACTIDVAGGLRTETRVAGFA